MQQFKAALSLESEEGLEQNRDFKRLKYWGFQGVHFESCSEHLYKELLYMLDNGRILS